MKKRIEDIRAAIDAVDDEIMKLLLKRSHLSVEMGRAKSDAQLLVFDPSREEEIISRLSAM
ncbi:MAG TPA: chorismate mutase, partial [Deltaproteobacteria bacterium]|nr:chorismate mutase [Deltaproteobacteria bacterium]